MKPIVIAILAIVVWGGCTPKNFPMLSRNAEHGKDDESPAATPTPTEQAAEPVLVTGVYLACSPIDNGKDTDAVGCNVADDQTKEKVDLNVIMRKWNFGVAGASPAPGAGIDVKLEQTAQQYHFKLVAAGGTKESRDAALKAAKISLDFNTRDDATSRVEYALEQASAIENTDKPDTTAKVTGDLLAIPLTIEQNNENGLVAVQKIPDNSQNVQWALRSWPQPTAENPIKSKVYFGVTALVVRNLALGFDLSFDLGGKHCASMIKFLPTDKGSETAFDCH
jgi:hypothetical protein